MCSFGAFARRCVSRTGSDVTRGSTSSLKGSHVSRVVRIDGATAKFIRPDERALATMVLKAIARAKADGDPSCFVPQRLGIAVAAAGLEAVLEDVQGEPLFVLEEGAPDLRKECLSHGVFFIGDHVGFHDCVRAKLKARGALARGIGPVSLHSDDVVTLVHNALDLAASGLG